MRAPVESSPENIRGEWIRMTREPEELLRGTLDALILKTLTWGPRHGYGIARWIKDTSRAALTVEDRALYLALHRLEDRGAVDSDWGFSDNNRRAKYYQLTAKGRAELKAESRRLARYAEGLFLVLNASAWEAR
jgi:PadR family transcriptional regulator, regulatory protein PadR